MGFVEVIKNMIVGDSLITLEIKTFKKEGLLNVLNHKCISVKNVRDIDKITLMLDVYYMDYDEVLAIVEALEGKVRKISEGKKKKTFSAMKKSSSLFLGIGAFFTVFIISSNFLWSVKIEGKEYLAPYEIRQELLSMGIKPGMLKSNINVYDLEKNVEKNIDEIMWINIRLEGSTLVVKYEEKTINNPVVEDVNLIGTSKVATMDGEIKRVYTSAGTACVKEGDIVKKGDVIIEGEQIIKDKIVDGEDVRKKVIPKGSIIANTFYEKIIELKVNGSEDVRTGEMDEEIYINVFGKKIYLKKASKDFKSYDKIEKKGNFLNKNIYYEKELEEITRDKQDIINEAVDILRSATEKELSRQSIIVDEEVNYEYISEGKISLKVLFIVEQDIVSF